MIRWYIIDDNGEVVPEPDTLKAALWFENSKNRVVACTEISKDHFLSTVFLSLDHNHWREGPPVLFESMWFGGDHDGEQRRYCTKEEALQGHKEMLEEAGVSCPFEVENHLTGLDWKIGLETLLEGNNGKESAV